jgi:hypothetical protein
MLSFAIIGTFCKVLLVVLVGLFFLNSLFKPVYCCCQIHSPWLGDIVGSGRGLSFSDIGITQCRIQLLYPQSLTMNLATGASRKIQISTRLPRCFLAESQKSLSLPSHLSLFSSFSSIPSSFLLNNPFSCLSIPISFLLKNSFSRFSLKFLPSFCKRLL